MSELTNLVAKQNEESYQLGKKHGAIEELEKIKEEIVELEKKMGQGIFTVELASEIVNDHIAELKGDKE